MEHGVEFTSIRAVPSGVVIEEENGEFKVVQHLKGVKSNLKIEEIGEELISRIDLFFEQFSDGKESAPLFKDANINMALSGDWTVAHCFQEVLNSVK